jgi:hypothetical protein
VLRPPTAELLQSRNEVWEKGPWGHGYWSDTKRTTHDLSFLFHSLFFSPGIFPVPEKLKNGIAI